jgi:hypothetical protein
VRDWSSDVCSSDLHELENILSLQASKLTFFLSGATTAVPQAATGRHRTPQAGKPSLPPGLHLPSQSVPQAATGWQTLPPSSSRLDSEASKIEVHESSSHRNIECWSSAAEAKPVNAPRQGSALPLTASQTIYNVMLTQCHKKKQS